MTPTLFKLIYAGSFGLMLTGLLGIVIPEIIAAWANKQPGDTITEIVRSLHLPGFIFVSGAGLCVALAIFGIALMFHLWGKWGL